MIIAVASAFIACSPSPSLHEERLPKGSQFDLKNTAEQWLSDADLVLARELIADFRKSDKHRANDRLYLVKANVDKEGNYYFIFSINQGDLSVLYRVEARSRSPVSRTLASSYAK